MTSLNKQTKRSPLAGIFLSFILLILAGAGLLYSPYSSGANISFIDALFTSTSAVCVTGLIVLDTAADFNLFGKTVIAVLIQLGGLGIMTFSLGLFTLLGRDISLRWRTAFGELYSDTGKIPVKKLLRRVVKYTFIIESVTAVLLFFRFLFYFPPQEALGHAVFHAVSAFCNAGFSTFSDSLMSFQNDTFVLLTVSAAVISGGLGFIVLNDIVLMKFRDVIRMKPGFSFHSKLVIIMTFSLLSAGTLLFFILERSHALQGMTLAGSLLNSFFQSVTCRTAGFNTVDIGALRSSTLYMMIFLMFAGGSPGSMAGGIKSTTAAILILLVISKLRGRSRVSFSGRSVDRETVERAVLLLIVSLFLVSFFIFIILAVKDFDSGHSFLHVMFEVVSAFGTVGLSTGITADLYSLDRLFVIVLMFTGRLGPLSFVMTAAWKSKKLNYEYPDETIIVG